MSLRHKILLIVGITISCVFMALSLILSNIWLRSFTEIENQQTQEVLERVQKALADDLKDLSSTLRNWAVRNDTYAFIEDSDKHYIEANLSDSTLANLRLNVMLFVHKRGHVVLSKGFDIQPKKVSPLLSRLKKQLATHPQLWQHNQPNSSRTGILLLPEGSLLVASQPILRSERQAEVRGTLIFGRYLDAVKLKRLEELTGTSITLKPFKEDQQSNTALSNPNAIAVSALSPFRIAGYAQLRDVYGNPSLLLRVDRPRTLYQVAQTSWQYLLLSLFGLGLLLVILTLLVLEKLVLSRLAYLATRVSRISVTGDPSQWFRDRGRDELSQLAVVIEGLLTALEESQTQLRQGNAELERRVEQRTADLIQANLRLEASHQEKDALLKREQAARAASEAARSEAEAANRIKDEFLAVLSHELRTPLNPILGWSKILRTRKVDEKTRTRALETIDRNAQLQTQLIEDLLDVSRILQGKLSLKICPVDLMPTIEAAVETVRLAAQTKLIEINTCLEANIGQVSGDPSRLQQVIWNLLSNAVKFTPQGGRVDVKLSKVRSQGSGGTSPTLSWQEKVMGKNEQGTTDNYVQIQISDTGKGINPEFLPHVFDYFRQEDSTTTRTFGGLGLGLAIVRHLVELHGGTVWAESQGEGLGATFTVRLPLMSTLQHTPQENESHKDCSNLEGIKVLVVDDEVDTLDLIAFVLEQYGAQVKAVTSPHLVIEVLAMWQPDVLLSDIAMPDRDGYQLIGEIRSQPPERGGTIPAIALTAYAGEINHQKALQAGFTAHITKPVEPAQLVAVIAKLGKV